MKLGISLILLFFFFAGCEQPDHQRDEVADESGAGSEGWPEQQMADSINFNKAVAVLHPAGKSNVKGIVTFTREDNVIKVSAEISGLKPGKHGFHIHEFGDCSAPDASSAGGHFNPVGNQHAGPTSQNRHTGDLGNIEADANGNASLQLTDSVMTFYGINSIIGHAVVVHEKEDDFTTQPTGDAGGRIACGVIGISGE
ncbi:MAG: superoxide dismutase family protein [Ignavibacteriaceae bacterium]